MNMNMTPSIDPTRAKLHVIRSILSLHPSPTGTHARAPIIEIAKCIRSPLECNLARALQVCVRLQKDDAFHVGDGETMGISLLDRDCVPDARTYKIIDRLIKKTLKEHRTGQFFIPNRRRFRFMLETKVRKNDESKIDWYLSHNSLVGPPIRSFIELKRNALRM